MVLGETPADAAPVFPHSEGDSVLVKQGGVSVLRAAVRPALGVKNGM